MALITQCKLPQISTKFYTQGSMTRMLIINSHGSITNMFNVIQLIRGFDQGVCLQILRREIYE